eukprot:CAMPEP_0182922446 /NCGR_PEP_ID=MMETSP0105_2-20130417/4803_1 /TAXON_ID=81532 ORGANISM="Acanthoeca-like sp., Strain 10tr" /NCGR_SAMPLE_ID=MMETSP0105_2 /ASSEMBLY_ACC=CAM_ASM_000205 /LENGTH=389 /DNA_ID=CAMNT_0025060063 /DNA_START=204 /DNA_END=1373 /DNA_ORIENTATION=-
MEDVVEAAGSLSSVPKGPGLGKMTIPLSWYVTMTVPLLLPLLLLMCQAWWDPTVGGKFQIDATPKEIAQWSYRKRLRHTLWYGWELSKKGPVFRAMAWFFRRLADVARAAGLAGWLDGPPLPPEGVRVSPMVGSTKVAWCVPHTGLLSEELCIVEAAQVTPTGSADPKWTEVFHQPCDGDEAECTVPLPLPWRLCRVRLAIVNSRGRSDWVSPPDFHCIQPPTDGTGGYGPEKAYRWSQTDTELEVRLGLPKECTGAKDLAVAIKRTTVEVTTLANDHRTVLFGGTMQQPLDPVSSFWELTGEAGSKELLLTLCKLRGGVTWPCVLRGHPQIDIHAARAAEHARDHQNHLNAAEIETLANRMRMMPGDYRADPYTDFDDDESVHRDAPH